MVSLANLAVGMTLLYPLLFSWTALFSFYFFRMRWALVQLALIGVNYAVVGSRTALLRWPLAVGTPAVTGLLMARLLAGCGARPPRHTGRERKPNPTQALEGLAQFACLHPEFCRFRPMVQN